MEACTASWDILVVTRRRHDKRISWIACDAPIWRHIVRPLASIECLWTLFVGWSWNPRCVWVVHIDGRSEYHVEQANKPLACLIVGFACTFTDLNVVALLQ